MHLKNERLPKQKINKRKKSSKQKLNKRKKRWGKNVVANLFFVFFTVLCLIMLSTTRTHLVDGNSMLPTFENRDRMIVSKTTRIERYDVVTFEPKDQRSKSYVKRIIGLPGDAIWLDGTNLYLNHQLREPVNSSGKTVNQTDIPDGTLKIKLSQGIARSLEGLARIPEKKYFVLGDNRNNSRDSRTIGLIDADQIEGVAVYRYYPFTRMGRIH
ncbi:signal peptidase I [Enterococcus rotai]|uniref:signal peptidase I n=1 Tax=Enterococcus rotai TaxID=118060 RepID=UPI0024466460|nr:signal peptidase I [Enterococcus rotai]